MSEEHRFDRRQSDANVASLATRIGCLESRVEVIELQGSENRMELRANTRICSQVHEALFGRDTDEEPGGLQAKVREVHGVFKDAQRGLAMLSKVADTGARLGKPVAYLAMVSGALIVFVKTGTWKWPPW